MPRQMLNDEHWSKLKTILLQQGIYHKPDLRMTVEGILYRMRSGCPWRDLPEVFGRCDLSPKTNTMNSMRFPANLG